jgi:hypothetical protein
MPRQNALAIIHPSSDVILSDALNGLQQQLYEAAERDMAETISQSPAPIHLTQLEHMAIIEIEALKLVSGLDLAAILLRGRILSKIREQNFLNVHPEHYSTLAEMANCQGISSTELSNVETCCSVIFPYMEENGLNVSRIWHDIGKAKFFELVPVLSAVITGTMPGRGATRDAVEAILNGSTEALGNASTEDVRAHAVDRLIEIGSTLPTREMRRQLRPDGTADIPAVFIRSGDATYAVLSMDADQVISKPNQNLLRQISGNYELRANFWSEGTFTRILAWRAIPEILADELRSMENGWVNRKLLNSSLRRRK